MQLIALSRKDIEAIQPSLGLRPSVAICIAYPTGRYHKVEPQDELRAVAHFRFSDCDERGVWSFPKNKGGQVAVPMTRGNAVDILDFVERWKDKIEVIYSACYGGVSRSRGVLAGLAAVYGWDDKELYAGGQPNSWCKRLIMQEAALMKMGRYGTSN